MALGFSTPQKDIIVGSAGDIPQRLVLVVVTGDGASYAAGGFSVTAATVGLTKISSIIPLGAGATGAAGAGFAVTYDPTSAKVKLWKSAGSAVLTEIAAGDWTSSQTCNLLVVGS